MTHPNKYIIVLQNRSSNKGKLAIFIVPMFVRKGSAQKLRGLARIDTGPHRFIIHITNLISTTQSQPSKVFPV